MVSAECTSGFDPLIGGSTAGCCGTEDVHCIGCGLTMTCVAAIADEDVKGK